MPIDIDTRDQSVHRYVYRGFVPDVELEEALDGMKRELEKAYSEKRMIGYVSISTPDTSMTSKQRARIAEWIRQETPLIKLACAGHALVIPGAVQRGVFTAIMWLVTVPMPIRAFASSDEGEAWLRMLPGFIEPPRERRATG